MLIIANFIAWILFLINHKTNHLSVIEQCENKIEMHIEAKNAVFHMYLVLYRSDTRMSAGVGTLPDP